MYIILSVIIILLLGIIIYNKIVTRREHQNIREQIEKDYLQENNEKLLRIKEKTERDIKDVEDGLNIRIEALHEQEQKEKLRVFEAIAQCNQTIEQLEVRKQEQLTSINELLCEKKAQNEEVLQQMEERKKEQLSAIEEVVAERKSKVDTDISAYLEVETQKARTLVEADTEAHRKWAEASLSTYWDGLAQCTQEKEQELAKVIEELNDYKKKQQVINEAILRQRAIDEQQDFYRVDLSQNTIDDIRILQDIRTKLHTSDSLNKLIYDVYVSKPVQEMIKRVLQGGAPSGIYKITRLKTGEIYIGKSTDIKKRWTEHCKTVYGVGSIAHSMLHTTMQKDGIENFTFEVVEEVPKEKLTEREKYWIIFYGSKEYGLNERNG